MTRESVSMLTWARAKTISTFCTRLNAKVLRSSNASSCSHRFALGGRPRPRRESSLGFSQPTCREPEAEIDVSLGHMASLADNPGAMKPSGPLRQISDAIEAKCLPRSRDDMSHGQCRFSQVKSDAAVEESIELGFSCVSALHVIATTPDPGALEAQCTPPAE